MKDVVAAVRKLYEPDTAFYRDCVWLVLLKLIQLLFHYILSWIIIEIYVVIYLIFMSNTKKIYHILPQISEALNAFIKHDEDHGLLSGYSGRALFYAYYYKLTGKKKYLNILNHIIEETLKILAEKELNYSHCRGIAGIAWGIQHLIKNDFIDQNESENIFTEINDILFNFMKHELSESHYDFLYQGLGIALYFLDRLPDADAETYLEEAVTQLEKASITNNVGISWRDNFTEQSEIYNQSVIYNLGLAHGMPAILSVLSMIHEKGIAVSKTLPLIENGIKWLLANKNEPNNDCVSLYPNVVTGNNKALGAKQSRLGWCYGDLGIAVTLWNIGTRLQNDYYRQEAYTIFEHTLQYRNMENGLIDDASICHGSMGVSHIYRRAYIATGDNLFLKGAQLWLQQTLQMAALKDGLNGFKYLTHKGYENNYNLLDGITGIGLGLIAAIDTDTSPAWDRCLLLS
ncbi:MAG: lanthionine synthetase C family protein [Segetibacter sp.]